MSHEAKKDEVTRREFIDTVATVSVIGAGAMTFLGVIQLPMPKVLNEPPAQFKVGFPAEYTVNSFKMVVERNVFIFRHEDGFRALSAVCTHLGCIVKKTDWGFACPCHGSQFDQDGNVIRGPAPRPLDWFRMTVAPDGQLLVDMKRTVRREDVLVV